MSDQSKSRKPALSRSQEKELLEIVGSIQRNCRRLVRTDQSFEPEEVRNARAVIDAWRDKTDRVERACDEELMKLETEVRKAIMFAESQQVATDALAHFQDQVNAAVQNAWTRFRALK